MFSKKLPGYNRSTWILLLSLNISLVIAFSFDKEDKVGGFSNDVQIAVETGECRYPFFQRANKCYYLSKTRANWFHATEYCRSHGADLLTIDDETENDFFRLLLKPNLTQWNDFAWTGGTDLGRVGEWLWLSTGAKINPCIMTWSRNNPDNSGGVEHCIGIFKEHGFLWNDYECSQEGRFVCQANIEGPHYSSKECVDEIQGVMSSINFTLAAYNVSHRQEIMIAVESALHALPHYSIQANYSMEIEEAEEAKEEK